MQMAILFQRTICKWQKSGIWQFFEKGKLVKETNMSFPENATKSKNK
jgi:hypothetical protein